MSLTASLSEKKLRLCVLPGLSLCRATGAIVTALMSELLPTLLRPAKAISGGPTAGRDSGLGCNGDKRTGK